MGRSSEHLLLALPPITRLTSDVGSHCIRCELLLRLLAFTNIRGPDRDIVGLVQMQLNLWMAELILVLDTARDVVVRVYVGGVDVHNELLALGVQVWIQEPLNFFFCFLYGADKFLLGFIA